LANYRLLPYKTNYFLTGGEKGGLMLINYVGGTIFASIKVIRAT